MHPRSILPLILVLVPNGKHENCHGRSNSALFVDASRSSLSCSIVSFVSTYPDAGLLKRTCYQGKLLGSSHKSRLRLANKYEGLKPVFSRRCRNSGSTSTSLLAYLSGYPSSNTFAAGGTLLIGTLLGILFDNISNTSGGGHVLTLLCAALIANLSQVLSQVPRVPTDHFLYDWCWGLFLPASLVFALLSSSPPSKQLSADTDSHAASQSSAQLNVTRNCILGMATPFIIGSIGSILGCIVSFIFVPMTTVTSQSTSSIASSKMTSAILAGCLCGSYIGGTVNFFAAAKLLTPLSNSNDMGSIFGSMAAADLVVMAVYFTALSAAGKSSSMRKLFPSKSNDCNMVDRDRTTQKTTKMISSITGATAIHKLGATSIAIPMAFLSVRLASQLEKTVRIRCNIPGTMCAFLALLGLSFNKMIQIVIKVLESLTVFSAKPTQLGGFMYSLCANISKSLHQISVVGPALCNVSFFFLFAAVGATADVSSAICGGPMALIFATVALIVHCATLLIGSLISLKVAGRIWPRSSWEEILTASNAAIGGPSTAAAFAAGLVPKSSRSMDTNIQYSRALVISATVYGVLGYAVGTSIGVLLTKFLIRWMT